MHIAKNGKFADFDFVLVGSFGVLCVNCLGYGGEIYANTNEDKWLQVLKQERTYFENPLKQAQNATRVVRDCLFEDKMKNVSVTSAVVFTNKNVSLAVGRNPDCLTPASFKALINKDMYITDKNVDKQRVISAIEKFYV